MLKVGITGGIGSGKSVVCQVFSALGIPVFNADDAARFLMQQDPILVQGIAALLGNEVYVQGVLNRKKVSDAIFHDSKKLAQLNALVHPATLAYGRQWFEKQVAPYVVKEAAIFFESGSAQEMNIMVGVYAPLELRIQRAMKRSAMSHQQVLDIAARQMNEDEKMKRCDHVIVNDDETAILPQVLRLHHLFLSHHAAN